jgi:Fe-S oxidoreductase
LVRLLEAAGVELVPVDAGCCGRTALSTGQIDKARAQARRAVASLAEWIRAGADVLVIEPSCLAMIRDDWRRLLPGDERVDLVATAARPALAAVADLAETGRLRFTAGGTALLHSHCHEKALSFSDTTERALGAVPELRLKVIASGCCGMSGIFGYEARHFETSVAAAEKTLLPTVRLAPPSTAVLATGSSCRAQIGQLSERTALHPLQFLADRVDAVTCTGTRRA